MKLAQSSFPPQDSSHFSPIIVLSSITRNLKTWSRENWERINADCEAHLRKIAIKSSESSTLSFPYVLILCGIEIDSVSHTSTRQLGFYVSHQNQSTLQVGQNLANSVYEQLQSACDASGKALFGLHSPVCYGGGREEGIITNGECFKLESGQYDFTSGLVIFSQENVTSSRKQTMVYVQAALDKFTQ